MAVVSEMVCTGCNGRTTRGRYGSFNIWLGFRTVDRVSKGLTAIRISCTIRRAYADLKYENILV
jgi:hypothetical protein